MPGQPRDGAPTTDGGAEETLREQLRLTTASAQAAYQDTARLIRLLSILGRPGTPDELVDETLTALAEVFQADVTCLARRVGDRIIASASCGLPEDDPAFVTGWAASPTALAVLNDGRPVTRALLPDDDAYAPVASLRLGSAAWLPLVGDEPTTRHLLILWRHRPDAFTGAELGLLQSVATRLLLAIQARRRAAALEHLARSGHVLPQHRQLTPLLDDAGRLFHELLSAERTAVFAVGAGPDGLTAEPCRADPGPGAPWDLGRTPVEALPGWARILDGRPHLLRSDRPDGEDQVLALPAGPVGAPEAVLYAGWVDLVPLMSPVVETAAIFATHLSAAIASVSLYRALSASEASLRLITDSISDLIAVVDPACRFVYASAAHERVVAHDPGSLVGRSVLDLVPPDDHVRLRDALLTSLATSSSVAVEYRFRTGDRGPVWVESVVRPADVGERNVVMSTRLIEERKNREDELRRMAALDPLTGLSNRNAATRRLEEALAADRPGEVGLLFCDLDRFKQVNDDLGHAAGDALLQQVAERLRRCPRAGDLIARLGGDEFVFVLDGVHTVDEVAEIGRRVGAEIARPFLIAGEPVQASVSVGAAIGARGRASAAAMLDRADAAMYEAKRDDGARRRAQVTRVGE